MLATYTEAVTTPLPFEDAAQAMSNALASILLATPSTETLALALAKTTLESGRQGDTLWTYARCWNLGNVKAGPQFVGQYSTYSCNEVLGGKVVWFSPFGRLSGKGGVVVAEQSANPPGHPQCRFRAFAGPTDGTYEYVDFVASGRYVDAWAELLEGDADGYVRALGKKGYFTADPDVYARGVISLQREFIAKLKGLPATTEFQPSVDVIDGLVAKQAWNQREIQAIATEAAFDAMHDNLRRHAHGEDPNDESGDDEPTKPDLPGNIS
jgi:hypothetical protein